LVLCKRSGKKGRQYELHTGEIAGEKDSERRFKSVGETR